MRKFKSFNYRKMARFWMLAASMAIALNHSQALRITDMPDELQTKNDAPVKRKMSLKLPLSQLIFQLNLQEQERFLGREAYSACCKGWHFHTYYDL